MASSQIAAPQKGTTHATEDSHQLDKDQLLRATDALLKHIASSRKQHESEAEKKNLLKADDSDGEDQELEDDEDVPIWMILTTKKYIAEKKKLKQIKIPIPHSLRASPTTTICLITADPQNAYKSLIAHPSFPAALSSRITRVIGFSKLKTKFKSFESRRQLRAAHDIFLADDRILTTLPLLLGKVFYKTTTRRPIPVTLTGRERFSKDAEGRKIKDSSKSKTGEDGKGKEGQLVGNPTDVAASIERALATALVNVSPSTTTSIQIGKARWDSSKIAENAETLMSGLVSKVIPHGWRNVKAVHIKGPATTALPVWAARELWVDEEEDVIEEVDKREAAVRMEERNRQKEERRREKRVQKKQRKAEANDGDGDDDDDAEMRDIEDVEFDDEVGLGMGMGKMKKANGLKRKQSQAEMEAQVRDREEAAERKEKRRKQKAKVQAVGVTA